MVHVALRGTNSEPYHATRIVYYSRSAWLLPLSARPARLLVLLPGQSGVYKFHHYFSDIKVPTYVFDIACNTDQRIPCMSSTDWRNPWPDPGWTVCTRNFASPWVLWWDQETQPYWSGENFLLDRLWPIRNKRWEEVTDEYLAISCLKVPFKETVTSYSLWRSTSCGLFFCLVLFCCKAMSQIFNSLPFCLSSVPHFHFLSCFLPWDYTPIKL